MPVNVKLQQTDLKAAIKEVFRIVSDITYFEIRKEQKRSIEIVVVGAYLIARFSSAVEGVIDPGLTHAEVRALKQD